jgi:hypothetical protein
LPSTILLHFGHQGYLIATGFGVGQKTVGKVSIGCANSVEPTDLKKIIMMSNSKRTHTHTVLINLTSNGPFRNCC